MVKGLVSFNIKKKSQRKLLSYSTCCSWNIWIINNDSKFIENFNYEPRCDNR